MLVLSRKVGEVVRIGDEVVLTVLRLQGGRVQLGIAAPPGVRILRREVGALEMAAAEPGERPA